MAVNQETLPGWIRPITQDELGWMVCPRCRESLELKEALGRGVQHIVCNGCKSDFPVIDGLPILIGTTKP